MVMLAALTAILVPVARRAALAIFALIAVLPQTALTFAGRTRPVASLDPLTATRRYSHALALHLGLDRAERRHLARVTDLAFARRAEAGDPIAYARQTLRDPSRASWEAGHVGEWWNGGGGPAGLRGPVTPITSRIVAVADTWSALTARGGPRALARRRARRTRERRRHPLRPTRSTGRLRRRGGRARVRERAGPGAAPAPAAPPRAAAPRHRGVLTTASTSRAVRSQVNSAARARPSSRQACLLGLVAEQARERVAERLGVRVGQAGGAAGGLGQRGRRWWSRRACPRPSPRARAGRSPRRPRAARTRRRPRRAPGARRRVRGRAA